MSTKLWYHPHRPSKLKCFSTTAAIPVSIFFAFPQAAFSNALLSLIHCLGRAQATPLTAWLRVPIAWVSSTTVAQFPDETHSAIRRVFTPSHEPYCKRYFCGFCGTHLSYWTEDPVEEADYLSITLGSLHTDDIRALQELDLLPEDVDLSDVAQSSGAQTDGTAASIPPSEGAQIATTDENTSAAATITQRSHTTRSGRLGDLDWFEELIHGSRLGRTQKTRRGAGVSADGNTQVQWEISEYVDDGDDTGRVVSSSTSSSKRKLGETQGVDDDVTMR